MSLLVAETYPSAAYRTVPLFLGSLAAIFTGLYCFLFHYEYAIYIYFLILLIMLNLNKVGRPLARIEGGKYNGMIVSVSDHFASNADDDQDQNGLIKEFRQLKIANDSKFQHIPDTTKEREILYITGPSGSGKSTYTRKYLEQYVKKFKNRPIYLFSSLPSDESLDKIKPKRIKLDDSLHTDPIKVHEFKESVCIFDDIDAISDKKTREAVYNILIQILEIGRHF